MAKDIELKLIVDDQGSATFKRFQESGERHIKTLSNTVKTKLGDAFQKMSKTAGSALKSIGRNLISIKTALIGVAVYGLARVISGWEELSGLQERAEAGMIAAMKAMGRHTDAFEMSLKNTASSLQKLSTFGDEAILMGTKFLVTYKAISDDVMPRAMAAMTDLAALMKGDFTSAANTLGKASMGMTGELRRIGITVDEDTFKTRGFIGVLEEIESQVKGQAEALRKTKSGGLEAFGNVIGDVKEKFGLFTSTIKSNIVEILLPHVEKLNEKLAEWVSSGDMEAWAKKAGKGIVSAFEGATGVIDKVYEAFKSLQWGLAAVITRLFEVQATTLRVRASIESAIRGSEGKVARGAVKGGAVQYITPELNTMISQATANAAAWRSIQEDTAKAYEKTAGAIGKVGDALKNTTSETKKATTATAQFFDYMAAAEGRDPFVLTPKIMKSPVQPWASGIAEMKADLAGIGGTIAKVFDVSDLNSIIEAMKSTLSARAGYTGGDYLGGPMGATRKMMFQEYSEILELQKKLLKMGISDVTRSQAAPNIELSINVASGTAAASNPQELARQIKRELETLNTRGVN